MTSTLLSLSTIGALIEVFETPFNIALPFVTNPYHNVASLHLPCHPLMLS